MRRSRAKFNPRVPKWNKVKEYSRVSPRSRSVFSLDAARKMAAVYIDTGEKVATDAIEFQAKANEWAKDTPLQALLEVRTSMGRKLVASNS